MRIFFNSSPVHSDSLEEEKNKILLPWLFLISLYVRDNYGLEKIFFLSEKGSCFTLVNINPL